MKVKVLSGDGKTDLGKGEYSEDVTTWGFVPRTGRGNIISLDDAEKKPADDLVASMKEKGYDLTEFPENPKIVLDDGKVVYGMQVWWEPVDDADTERVRKEVIERRRKLLAEFAKDRDEALLSFDREKLLEFANKWHVDEATKNLLVASDEEIFLTTIHKAITGSKLIPMDKRLDSKKWLTEHDKHSLDDGELS